MQHYDELEAWVKRTTKGEGSLIDTFLFIGVVTAVTILWTRVIARLVD